MGFFMGFNMRFHGDIPSNGMDKMKFTLWKLQKALYKVWIYAFGKSGFDFGNEISMLNGILLEWDPFFES